MRTRAEKELPGFTEYAMAAVGYAFSDDLETLADELIAIAAAASIGVFLRNGWWQLPSHDGRSFLADISPGDA